MAQKITRHIKEKRRVPAKPTAILALHNGAADKIKNKAEPKPQLKAPSPPGCLDATALKEWRFIVPVLLDLGLLTELDGTALALYCQNYSLWYRASLELKKKRNNEMLKNKSGAMYRNPWLDVRNRADVEMYKHLALFGLSPADRAKMKSPTAPAANKPHNPFDDL